MVTLYFLAYEPVKNQQQLDCHLVAIIYAPDGSDSGALRKEAENKIKEEVDKKFALGERLALRFTDKDTASEGKPFAKRKLLDRKSTRLNSSHTVISYAVFCLNKNKPMLIQISVSRSSASISS